MGSPILIVGSVCGIGCDIYVVLFRKMDFGHEGNVYFLNVEEYFYNAVGQLVFIPLR
jgi:hypothetical protein